MELLLVMLVVSCLSQAQAQIHPGCDEDLIAKINTFWKEAGTPEPIKQILPMGDVCLASVTPLEIDAACVCGVLKSTSKTETDLTITFTSSKGESSSEKFALEEKKGYWIEKSEAFGVAHRYFVLIKNYCIAYYYCTPGGKVTGSPQGGILVSKNKIGRKEVKDTLELARGVMRLLYINVETDLNRRKCFQETPFYRPKGGPVYNRPHGGCYQHGC